MAVRGRLYIWLTLSLYMFMKLECSSDNFVTLIMLFVPILNESNDFEYSPINFMLKFGKVDLLLFEKRKGFRIIKELIHMAVNLLIVLILKFEYENLILSGNMMICQRIKLYMT